MYGLSVEQYRFFGENGYLRVEGLIGNEELQALDRHSMALACNEVDLNGLPVEARNEGTSPADMEDKYFRFIQFHKHMELHERYMLHGRVLDVLAQLIGPDVMAMQSMLFLKPPARPVRPITRIPFISRPFPIRCVALGSRSTIVTKRMAVWALSLARTTSRSIRKWARQKIARRLTKT